MSGSSRRADWRGIALLLALYLVPAAITSLVLGASWRAIAIAYAAWLGLLLLFSLWPGNGRWRDKAGWAFGLGMFLSTPAVLTILLLLREAAGIR